MLELETNTSTFLFFNTLKVRMDISYFLLEEMGPIRLLEKGCCCLATKESTIKKLLIPKIPLAFFLPNFVVSDKIEKINFSKNKGMIP